MSLILLLKQYDDADKGISYEECNDNGEFTLPADIEESYFDGQLEVPVLSKVCWEKSFPTMSVQLLKQ